VDPPIGTELAGYRIEALLGRGGMSVVFRAEDKRLRRKVALKLLARELAEDERFRERFLRESQLASSIDHPGVVPVYDVGDSSGQLYIAMRYVEGSDLRRILEAEGKLEPARALAICAQVADALDAAHERGLVHRDVKPSNVLIASQRGREYCYLADFGLSKDGSEDSRLAVTEPLVGTTDYVSPEQIRGEEVDARADVYGLGCLLYECLTGGVPFRSDSEIEVVYAHLEEPPPRPSASRPELGEAIDTVIAKAMAKDSRDRYATCVELFDGARAALGFLGDLAPPAGRGRRTAVAALAAGVALIAAALALFFTRGAGPPEATGGGVLVRIDPATNRAAAPIELGDPLSGVVAGDNSVWAASFRDAALYRVDPGTTAATRIPAAGAPRDMAAFGGRVYVIGPGPRFGADNVTVYDAGNGNRIDSVGLIGYSVAAGRDGVWAAGFENVQRLSSAGRLRIRTAVPIPYRLPLDTAHERGALSDVALFDGSLWVLGDAADRRLWRIDPRTNRTLDTIELPFLPLGLAGGAGSVWVTDQLGDAVVRIDPTTGRIVARIPVGRGAGGIAFGAGSVWAASFLDRTVSRIDPGTNRVVATIAVPGTPRNAAVGAGAVWIAGDAS
jgi:streptogramin lyase